MSRHARRLLESLGPGASLNQLVRHARYSGIQIGAEGHGHAWHVALQKYHQRCIDIRRLRLGLAMAIRMYAIFAVSLLRYVMQSYPLARAVRNCEQKLRR
eukprot:7380211-Pyramimonas_sp.AAC.2